MSRIAEAAYGDRPYPASPGFKTGSTSQKAAQAVAQGSGAVRERVFQAISASAGGLTADEAAAIVGRKPAYCRPRCSELRAAGRIVPSIGAPAEPRHRLIGNSLEEVMIPEDNSEVSELEHRYGPSFFMEGLVAIGYLAAITVLCGGAVGAVVIVAHFIIKVVAVNW